MPSALDALDGRLRALAALVRPGARLADIGCDHGHLICALTADQIIPGGVACDVNEQPLAKARAQAERLSLSARIDCRMADGLTALSPDEADDIVIAGMGGELIASILTGCPWHDAPGKRFLLQPMTRPEQLRDCLARAGFALECERACAAAGRYYTVMVAVYTGQRRAPVWDDLWLYRGALPQSPSPEAAGYLHRLARSLRRRAVGLSACDPDRSARWAALADALEQTTQGW